MTQAVLDEEQQFVVDSDKSSVVIAGPGSGKTRVLTEKARKEFNAGKNILCLTFTRSAAKEMQDRVKGLPACTIHSYCCGTVGWDETWGYEGLLLRYLWEKSKTRFDWVLLDECQDVNQLELDVVLSMVGDKIFAVGDPYQSIYGFQGAMGYSVNRGLKALGAEEVSLHNNYRSCKSMVSRLETIYRRDLISCNTKDTGLTFVLCRTNSDVSYVSDSLKRMRLPHTLRLSVDRAGNSKREREILGPSNIRVMTIHCSKGLEADRVVLYNWRSPLEGEEKQVYYVCCSRASQEFFQVDSIEEVLRYI